MTLALCDHSMWQPPRVGAPAGRSRVEPLRALAGELLSWLLGAALPAWATMGLDRTHGGFHDLLDQRTGAPVPGAKRSFVQARQIHVFAEAARLGWDGPADDIVDFGLEAIDRRCRRADWGFVHSFGAPTADDRRQLYDHAFVAFGLASSAAIRPGRLAAARAVLDEVDARWPSAGDGYADPDGPHGATGLGQNAHMHLSEAAIAVAAASGSGADLARAERLVDFVDRRLFLSRPAVVPERFDRHWRPLAEHGRIRVEPGHQFEWAWLLSRLAEIGGSDRADRAEAAWRFASRHGVDRTRGVAVDAVDQHGGVLAASARLWPQTERLRAALAMLEREIGGAEAEAVQAAESLARYLQVPVPGLFHDTMAADGTVVAAPARASSLYHIVGAVSELVRVAAP